MTGAGLGVLGWGWGGVGRAFEGALGWRGSLEGALEGLGKALAGG